MRSSPVAGVVVVALSSLLFGSCATEPVVRWGDETPVETPKTAAVADEPARPKTATEYAARFPTDGACEAEARRIDVTNRELALRLLGACIERGDFKRIAALLDAPWTPSLRAMKEAPVWCARVIAARAGDIESDVKACASSGLGVRTLEQLFGEPDKVKGTVVIFRARVDPEHTGKDVRLMETAIEDGEVETAPTGRRVDALIGGHRLPVRDAVLLGRASRMAEDKDAEDGEFMAVIEILGSFPAAALPTFN